MSEATVAVIGAGQAGLSAGYHLKRLGFVDARERSDSGNSFIIFDQNPAPGGAWQHRWRSLTMETVNGIFDLPDFPKPEIDPLAESRVAVPAYFADFEREMGLPIVRPVTVTRVSEAGDPPRHLNVETSAGAWRVRAIINATGTWNNPLLPEYEGAESFAGEMMHAREFREASDFAGRTVAVVGAEITAVQLLDEISRHTRTYWYTRSAPDFRDGSFRPEVEGRDVIARVTADAEAGNPPRSIVSYTGLPLTGATREALARGTLERRPMFQRIEPTGVREADGSFTSVDVILWATGYRADLGHRDPLSLKNERGGIALRGTAVAADPRIHLIGYGPSQSTVGANRAGRQAAQEVRRLVRG